MPTANVLDVATVSSHKPFHTDYLSSPPKPSLSFHTSLGREIYGQTEHFPIACVSSYSPAVTWARRAVQDITMLIFTPVIQHILWVPFRSYHVKLEALQKVGREQLYVQYGRQMRCEH